MFAENKLRFTVPDENTALWEMWEEAYLLNKRRWLRVMSNSMFPIMEAGDRVLVVFVAPSQIAPADIVTYWFKHDRLMSHRVVGRVRKNGEFLFLEKADRGIYASLITQKQIIGKITAIQKSGRVFALNNCSLGFANYLLGLYSISIFQIFNMLNCFSNNRRNLLSLLYSRSLVIFSLIPGKIFSLLRGKR